MTNFSRIQDHCWSDKVKQESVKLLNWYFYNVASYHFYDSTEQKN